MSAAHSQHTNSDLPEFPVSLRPLVIMLGFKMSGELSSTMIRIIAQMTGIWGLVTIMLKINNTEYMYHL